MNLFKFRPHRYSVSLQFSVDECKFENLYHTFLYTIEKEHLSVQNPHLRKGTDLFIPLEKHYSIQIWFSRITLIRLSSYR